MKNFCKKITALGQKKLSKNPTIIGLWKISVKKYDIRSEKNLQNFSVKILQLYVLKNLKNFYSYTKICGSTKKNL